MLYTVPSPLIAIRENFSSLGIEPWVSQLTLSFSATPLVLLLTIATLAAWFEPDTLQSPWSSSVCNYFK